MSHHQLYKKPDSADLPKKRMGQPTHHDEQPESAQVDAGRQRADHTVIAEQITETARMRSEMIGAMKRRLMESAHAQPPEEPVSEGEPAAEGPPEDRQRTEFVVVASRNGHADPRFAERTPKETRAAWAPRMPRPEPPTKAAPEAPEGAPPADEASLSRATSDDFLFSEGAREGSEPAWDRAWDDAQNMEHALAKFAEVLSRDQKREEMRDQKREPKRDQKVARAIRKSPKAKPFSWAKVLVVFALSFMVGISVVLVAYSLNSHASSVQRRVSSAVGSTIDSALALYSLLVTKSGFLPAAASEEPPAADSSSQSDLGPTPAKPVITAKLEVADAQGESQNEIPLSISALPANPGRPVNLLLSGLPHDAVLTSGEKQSDGSWLLKPGEERNLFLSLPSLTMGDLLVDVEAVESGNGELAAPPQELRIRVRPAKVVVEPAAEEIAPVIAVTKTSAEVPAPSDQVETAGTVDLPVPPPLPAPSAETAKVKPAIQIAALEQPQDTKPAGVAEQSIPAAEVTDGVPDSRTNALLDRGNQLLAEGDIVSARSFYELAFNLGNSRAARPLARTFDPLVLQSLGVKGLKPDPQKALDWYEKARSAGEEEVASDIEALQAYLVK